MSSQSKSRNINILLYGLAKALESGTQTYLDRSKENRTTSRRQGERQEDLMRWASSQQGVQDRFDQREERMVGQEASREQAKTAPFSEESFFDKLGTPGARTKYQDLIEPPQGPPPPGYQPGPTGSQADPDTIRRLLEQLGQENPTGVLPKLDQVSELDRVMKESPDLGGMEQWAQVQKSVGDRDVEIQERRANRSSTERVQSMLQEQLRRMTQRPAPAAPGAPQQQQGQGQGGDGGMGYAAPRMPPLDATQFSQLPQGEGAGMEDEVQLGQLANHFNTLMQLQPGGASMTELAQAWQWYAENTEMGEVPVWVDMFAQGVPGAPHTREMPAVREIIG